MATSVFCVSVPSSSRPRRACWLEPSLSKGLRTGFAVVAAVVGWLSNGHVHAAVIASDTASNYTANANLSNLDGGFGYQPWQIFGSTTGTAVVNSTSTNFVATHTSGGSFLVSRDFDNPLGVGETSSILSFSTSGTGVAIGWDVSTAIDLYFFWDGSRWVWSDRGSNTNTNISSLTSLSMSFLRTGPSSYVATLSDGGTPFSVTATSTGSAGVVGHAISISTPTSSVTFNGLQVVPEPSTYAMLVAGGLTAFGAAGRRRRRQAALAL
jgi:hypothetical protein